MVKKIQRGTMDTSHPQRKRHEKLLKRWKTASVSNVGEVCNDLVKLAGQLMLVSASYLMCSTF